MKPLRLTIRTRLTLMFAFSAVLILLGLSIYIYYFTYNFRKSEFRYRMKERLVEADSLLRRNSAYPFITLDHLPPGTLPDEVFYYRKPAPQITVQDGNTTIALGSLAEIEQQPYYYTRHNQREYLVYYDKKLNNVVVLSAVDVFGYTKLTNLKQVLSWGILIGTVAMAFISWYWPRRELRPISDKIKKARRIGGQSLNLRLNVRNDYDELGELAITFNQMLDRIEQAFEVQKQFISNAAHELRNPITAISGDAQLALMQERSGEEYKATLLRINNKTQELTKLVERLLILSKIESATSVKAPVRVDEILIDAVTSVQSRYPAAAATIRLHMEEENSESYTIPGDAVMLQVAFDNIIDNALKYGNGKPVQVHLGCEGGQVQLQVNDEGIGIEESEKEKLFSPFYRNEAVRHIQGTGIGLALVKSIVQWHGGTIALEGNGSGGATVRVQFNNRVA